MDRHQNIQLYDGAKISVIGGGPAGSFFAYLFLQQAKRLGREVKITIFDGKSFGQVGPIGCNMCAGTLGSNLLNLLGESGYSIPDNVIRHEVTGYTFHFKNKSVQLWQAPQRKIVTVYRGMGPYSGQKDNISFDQYLLDQAVSNGALYESKNIDEIILPSHTGKKPIIRYDNKRHETDLVVGAFGVNSSLSRRMNFGYIPPKSWSSCQAEIEAGSDFIKNNLKGNIHIFNIKDPLIKFVALVPKKNFISVSVIGPHIRIKDLNTLLTLPEFRNYIPSHQNIRCHCHPKIPVAPAKKPYNDRFIIIGDACNSRYLKNGIESAFQTASLAANTVLTRGISKGVFYRYYYLECKKLFNFDNLCGKLIFGINNIISSRSRLATSFIDFTTNERKTQPEDLQLTSQILWNMFTGDKLYKSILTKAIHPKTLSSVGTQLLKGFINDKVDFITPKVIKVGIIGGGPGGSSCAIKLLIEAKKLNKDINVTIFEGKDFKRHYNQCVGVLSPPLEEVLNEKLDIKLHEDLIKRTILGYKLHGDKKELTLSETSKYHTYAVRRVEFDKFLLDKAESLGAKIIQSRVTHVEFIYPAPVHRDWRNKRNIDEVRIYCESGYEKVDVIVAASGVDDVMLNELEQATKDVIKFKGPSMFLSTIITKIHTESSFIDRTIKNYVHAFLLSGLPNIEFGAITPKGDHIIINIAGKTIDSLDMDTFLRHPEVEKLLPEINFDKLEYFKGKFPVSSSKNPYGHRFVAVGDATGWMRPFKGKGINTAIITGIKAAETILYKGITKRAFQDYKTECQNLTEDHRFGTIARSMCRFCKNTKLFDSIIDLAKTDLSLYDILYQCISGETLYRDILKKISNPILLWQLSISIIRNKFKR